MTPIDKKRGGDFVKIKNKTQVIKHCIRRICENHSTNCRGFGGNNAVYANTLLRLFGIENAYIREIPLNWDDAVAIYFDRLNDVNYYSLCLKFENGNVYGYLTLVAIGTFNLDNEVKLPLSYFKKYDENYY